MHVEIMAAQKNRSSRAVQFIEFQLNASVIAPMMFHVSCFV